MGTAELLALSLGLSVAMACFVSGIAWLFERTNPDATLREKAWAIALYLPALPVVLVSVTLALPSRILKIPTGPEPESASAVIAVMASSAARDWPIGENLAITVLGVAGLLLVTRAARLAWRIKRLNRVVQTSTAAPPAILRLVEEAARRQELATPEVRITTVGREALVAGMIRPVLILPENLTSDAVPSALEAICDHELAHLKRGDHRALWLEEALLTVLAINPMLWVIRAHRSAAREEACDATALVRASEDTRRMYARSLLNAFRASPRGEDAPALTFIGNRRVLVMRRLNAILSPAPRSRRRHRFAGLGLGVAGVLIVGTSSLALAAQRESVFAPQPAATIAKPMPRPQQVRASEDATRPTTITDPGWVRRPKPLLPEAAAERGMTTGSTDLSCTAQQDGWLSGCRVVGESPVGLGYGAAALEAAAQARLSPRTIDNSAAGATVLFSVSFRSAAN